VNSAGTSVTYRSPLHQMTETTPTSLWNDSAAIDELTYAMEHGAVGATCNPVIAAAVLAWQADTMIGLHRDPPVGELDSIPALRAWAGSYTDRSDPNLQSACT